MNRRSLLLAGLAAAGLAPMGAAAEASETKRLNRRLASRTAPRDVFRIGEPVSMLDVRIRNSGLWIERVVFEFADGGRDIRPIGRRIPKGGVAAAASVGKARLPTRIEVVHALNGGERPVIEIWGTPASIYA